MELVQKIQSKELNQYGRSFVIIGRRTFSAAQMLSNVLEKYTRVLFVGEPTGAKPDHFGDSKKIRLLNSGLTLRVSSLHWSSLLGNDKRDFLSPDLPAYWTSEKYFSGDDPSIEAVLAYTGNLKSLIQSAFIRGDEYQVFRYITGSTLAPNTYLNNLYDIFLQIGKDFISEGKIKKANLVYRYGLYFYPDNIELKTAVELSDS